ncbi:MAG: transcription termination factor NusA [Gammaproteobacteria bacterium]|nr:transcription termination factor NusA [Gammaproteobacteria bacterium]
MAVNKEILLVAETVSNEKGVPQKVIFEAIEEALEVATKKKVVEDIRVNVVIDPKTGDYKTFRQWEVLASESDIEDPDTQMTLAQVAEDYPDATVGDIVEEMIESVEFGRISAQIAKHIIIQKVREAERMQVANQYRERIGHIINGTVKKLTRDYVILDLGANAEGFILRGHMLPREMVRVGDRLRAYLYEVSDDLKGPQILLSRTHKGMLIELFRVEVPEIGEDVIEIKAAARDPGLRAKIAVKTNDGRIDPRGACIGMRGARVQAVSGELGGERVDVVLWDDNPVQFVINAMEPAEVLSIVVNEDSHSMDLAVKEAQLSQAIGKGGQNVHLATQLTGWSLNIMTEGQALEKHDAEDEKLINNFITQLGIEHPVAKVLVEEGFTTIEELAYVDIQELLEIQDIEQSMLHVIRDKAKDMMLMQAIAKEEAIGEVEPAEDLLEMENMSRDIAFRLAAHGIVTREDLAEQAIDDLMEIDGMNEAMASELIMTARKIWFE